MGHGCITRLLYPVYKVPHRVLDGLKDMVFVLDHYQEDALGPYEKAKALMTQFTTKASSSCWPFGRVFRRVTMCLPSF